MITRIARNDIVRLTRTGEVGLVKGWADHENLDRHGTIVDVEIAQGKVVQANGLALEFVANAKRGKNDYTLGQSVWVLVTLLASMAWGVYLGWLMNHQHHVPVITSVFVGFSAMYFAYNALWLYTIRPKKTRIRVPKMVTGYPRQSVNR